MVAYEQVRTWHVVFKHQSITLRPQRCQGLRPARRSCRRPSPTETNSLVHAVADFPASQRQHIFSVSRLNASNPRLRPVGQHRITSRPRPLGSPAPRSVAGISHPAAYPFAQQHSNVPTTPDHQLCRQTYGPFATVMMRAAEHVVNANLGWLVPTT